MKWRQIKYSDLLNECYLYIPQVLSEFARIRGISFDEVDNMIGTMRFILDKYKPKPTKKFENLVGGDCFAYGQLITKPSY